MSRNLHIFLAILLCFGFITGPTHSVQLPLNCDSLAPKSITAPHNGFKFDLDLVNFNSPSKVKLKIWELFFPHLYSIINDFEGTLMRVTFYFDCVVGGMALILGIIGIPLNQRGYIFPILSSILSYVPHFLLFVTIAAILMATNGKATYPRSFLRTRFYIQNLFTQLTLEVFPNHYPPEIIQKIKNSSDSKEEQFFVLLTYFILFKKLYDQKKYQSLPFEMLDKSIKMFLLHMTENPSNTRYIHLFLSVEEHLSSITTSI